MTALSQAGYNEELNKRMGAFFVFTTSDNRIFMLQRRDGTAAPNGSIIYHPKVREFPGGGEDKEKDNGNPLATAIRETEEETGFRVEAQFDANGFLVETDKIKRIGVYVGIRANAFFYHYRLDASEQVLFEEAVNRHLFSPENIIKNPEHLGFDFLTMDNLFKLLESRTTDAQNRETRHVMALPGDIAVYVLQRHCDVPLPRDSQEWKGLDGDLSIDTIVQENNPEVEPLNELPRITTFRYP